MDGEYSHEWADLRKLRRRMATAALSAAVCFALIGPLNMLPRGMFYGMIGFLLFAGWVISIICLLVFMTQYVYWYCPRCGKPFHRKTYTLGNVSAPFAARCLNCGLPKWVDSDPDPKLKHEIDPFRSDAIFKLGDTGLKSTKK